MAPGHSSLNHDERLKPHHSNKEVLLPLVPKDVHDKLTSENTLQFQLLSTPADADSPKYKFNIRLLKGGESVRALIQWYQDVQKVMAGLNVTDYTGQLSMCRTMMGTNPLSSFNAGITAALTCRKNARIEAAANDIAKRAIRNEANLDIPDNQNVDDVVFALQQVLTQAMPRQVLAKVKRHIRRECRKPIDMKIRTYVQHLRRINEEELPRLPPFRANQALTPDELLDIVLFGAPK